MGLVAVGDSDKDSEEVVAEDCAALGCCVEVSNGCCTTEDGDDRLGIVCKGDGATS